MMQENPTLQERKSITGTVVAYAAAVLIIFTLTLLQFVVRKETLPSEYEYKLINKTELYLDELPGEVTLRRGELVKVLGHVEGDNFQPHQVWVETSSGNRGYLPVEALEPSVKLRKGETKGSVVIIGWKKSFSTYSVMYPDGSTGEVRVDNVISPFADMSEYNVNKDGDGWRPMSEDKFKKFVMSKSFDQMQESSYPAHFLTKQKDGGKRVIYPLKVFKNGKFYAPIVSYNSSGEAVHYLIPNKPLSEINGWLLRLLPLYESLCDSPLVWPLWTRGVYDNGQSFLLLLLLWLCPPLLIPALIFGLLKFTNLLSKYDQNKLISAIKVLFVILLIIWFYISLIEYFIWPILLATLILAFVVLKFVK